MSYYGYTTRFFPLSIEYHSHFSSTSVAFTSTVLSVVSQSGVTINSQVSEVVTLPNTYSNQSVTYVLVSSVSSTLDVYFQISTQSFTVTENTYKEITPDLPCSSTGATSISFALASYNGGQVPSFVSIDTSSGMLKITAPQIISAISYSFYISSSIAGYPNQVLKLINLSVVKCTATNCNKWDPDSSSTCVSWITRYGLNNGAWYYIEASTTATALSIVMISLIGGLSFVVIMSRIFNADTMSSLWSIVNECQLFFFLLLARSYIPKDVETIIVGLKFFIFPFDYFQLQKIPISNYFEWDQSNSGLSLIGINSWSSISNLLSLLVFLFWICWLHILVLLQNKLLSKWKSTKDGFWIWSIKWITNKSMSILAYGFYIRCLLQINQYVLLSSVSEVFNFNTSKWSRIISLVFAINLLIFWLILFWLTFCLMPSTEKMSEDEQNKLDELIVNPSNQKKSRIYTSALLFRRMVFVVLLVWLVPTSPTICLGILSGIQIIYLFFIIILRPFEDTKSNIIEITNELYFTVLFSSLIYYDSESKWNSTDTSIFVWIIASNSMTNVYIAIGNSRPLILI